MKKILVTGAAGFIGMHLSLALQKRGNLVFGYDNFNDYYSVELKKKRSHLLQQQGIEILSADLCDPKALAACIDKHSITHVVHLAAQAGVRHSLLHPEEYVASNLSGFVHLLETLKTRPSIRCVFASSSSVYGLNTHVPFAETDPTDRPASFYGATKKSNELIAHAYHHTFNIPLIGLRFFTVYGPWGRPDMAYFSFTRAICEGAPITLYGNGEVQRDFTYIDDIIKGIISALDHSIPFDIINLGNHQPETVNRLVDILESLLNKKAIRRFAPLPAGDVPITYADLTKSKRLLNYHPSIDLETGLRHFTTWYVKAFS